MPEPQLAVELIGIADYKSGSFNPLSFIDTHNRYEKYTPKQTSGQKGGQGYISYIPALSTLRGIL